MDLEVTFKKYFENYKIILSLSILFLFLLFLINPIFSIYGGNLNVSYNLLNQTPGDMILTIISCLVLILVYSLIQTVIIYKIGSEYRISDRVQLRDIKSHFVKLTKFNWIFFLLVYGISVTLYDLFLLNNAIVSVILLFITLLFWFVPQVIIMEKEGIGTSMAISAKYWKRGWFFMISLFVAAFILMFLTYVIDIALGHIVGPVISTLIFVIFIIPFVEILKTEIYLNKYRLLKPRHQL